MEKRKTQVITGEVRFSYAHVWEPSSINGGDEKYSVSIIIPKSDTKTIKAITTQSRRKARGHCEVWR